MKEMDIKPHSILVRDLVAGYSNDPNQGVYAYGGEVHGRPPF